MNRNLVLAEAVLAELAYDPEVDATHIGVSADDGVVTLTGYTGSLQETWRAEAAAARVRGVRAVTRQLSVRLPEERKLHDDEIAHRVCRILEWEAAIPEDRIHVSVHNGLVTLAGDVDGEHQRAAAAAGVRRLSGVTGVVNHLEIRPDNRADHVAADVSAGIAEALERQADLAASRIKVEAADGRVTLTGTVHNRHERSAVRRAAWRCRGVVGVEDHLIISG